MPAKENTIYNSDHLSSKYENTCKRGSVKYVLFAQKVDLHIVMSKFTILYSQTTIESSSSLSTALSSSTLSSSINSSLLSSIQLIAFIHINNNTNTIRNAWLFDKAFYTYMKKTILLTTHMSSICNRDWPQWHRSVEEFQDIRNFGDILPIYLKNWDNTYHY